MGGRGVQPRQVVVGIDRGNEMNRRGGLEASSDLMLGLAQPRVEARAIPARRRPA